MTDFAEIKDLAIARAEEAAKYHGVTFKYEQRGTWIYVFGEVTRQKDGYSTTYAEIGGDYRLKARGWKNASDAFVAAVTKWAQQERAKSKQALKDALDEARLVGEAVDVDPDNWSTNY